MNHGERTLLAGTPEVGCGGRSAGSWNGLWQSAVGNSMGREGGNVTHVEQGLAATIRAELTR